MTGVKIIRDLEDLLSSSLKNNEKIVNSDISLLTAPGENFGAIVLRISLEIKNTQTETCRILDAVGKTIPEGKKLQKLCNTQVTFRNEYMFYSSIVPLLDKFARKKGITTGIHFIAPFLGGRINLNNNEEVDMDAIIMMENLKSLGYTTGKKAEGLNLEGCKSVIESLAKFHAISLAIKTEEPKIFETEIKPYCSDYVPEDEFLDKVKEKLYFTLRNNNLSEEEIERVSVVMNRDCHKTGISQLWGTMIHYDSWTNNLMTLYKDNVPVHSIIVDFQDFGYGTPLNDLMLFLFTSVQTSIFEESLDDLLDYYYKHLVQGLKELKIDTEQFSPDSFDQEVKIAVKHYEYCHSIWMLVPIMQENLTTMDDLAGAGIKNWGDKHIKKILQITRLCLKREWI